MPVELRNASIQEYDQNWLRQILDRDFSRVIYYLYRPPENIILTPDQVSVYAPEYIPKPAEMERLLDDPIDRAYTFHTFTKRTGISIHEDKEFGRVIEVISDDPDLIQGTIAKARLIYAYLFLSRILPRKDDLLDVGTYDGDGTKQLIHLARNILSIDDDEKMLERAASNFFMQDFMRRTKPPMIRLEKMRAQDINFTEKFDYVVMIEILTGGFHGTQEDAEIIINNAYRALKPGGKFIFTVPSRAAAIRRAAIFGDIPGKSIQNKFKPYREYISEILDKIFGKNNGKYYGQMPSDIDNENWGIRDALSFWREDYSHGKAHIAFTSDRLIPRPIGTDDLALYMYAHHLGIWTKPAKQIHHILLS